MLPTTANENQRDEVQVDSSIVTKQPLYSKLPTDSVDCNVLHRTLCDSHRSSGWYWTFILEQENEYIDAAL